MEGRCLYLWLLVGVFLFPSAEAELMKLPVTADNSIAAYPPETRFNDGAKATLKLKSWQHVMLVDFDAAQLRGRVVRRATFHVHFARDENPSSDCLRRVGISTVGSAWVEGTGRGEEVPGASCFAFAALDGRSWAYPGSDFTAVVFGQGHTIYDSVEATPPDQDDWQSVAVDARLMQACVAGISHGIAFSDDLGTDWTITEGRWNIRLMPNRNLHSREENRFAPYFTVEFAEEDRQPPEAPGNLAAESGELPAGELRLRWRSPRDQGPAGVVGYFVRYSPGERMDWERAEVVPRYLIPTAAEPGQEQQMDVRDLPLEPGAAYTFALRAVDAAGNVGPLSTVTGMTSTRPRLYQFRCAAPELPTPAAGECRVGSVLVYALDACEKVDARGQSVAGLAEDAKRGSYLWDARRGVVTLRAARNEFVAFHLVFAGEARQVDLEVEEWTGPGATVPLTELWREWYVEKDGQFIPDALVPYGGPFAIPDTERPIPQQRAQGVLVDVYVPHETEPGSYRVPVTLSADGEMKRLELSVEVLPLRLPDELTFRVELNAYSTPGGESEWNDHRLAHRYRSTLNQLPYSQSGRVHQGCAPKLVNGRLEWTAWDQRFGAYFDGSAFADLPRKGVPLAEFYLPVHENWPGDVHQSWNESYWADEAFSEDYRKLFADVSRQFAEHFRQKGWTRTQFQFYLNNKNTYRTQGSRSGSSPWVLDEPVDGKDFAALAYFARAFHEGIDQVKGDVDLVFRIDISRPEGQRRTLDGLVGLAVVGQSAFDRYNRMVRDRAHETGEMLIIYGSANHLDEPNARMVAWAVGAWSKGADGILPWQTRGQEDSWEKADQLAVLYPAKSRFGHEGSYPSLRLVGFRRGQQDVEYINLLRQASGADREALARALIVALGLTDEKTVVETGFNAGRISFSNLSAADFARLRLLLQSELVALSKGYPAATPR